MEHVELLQRRQAILYLDYADVRTLQQGCSIHVELSAFQISIELAPVANQRSRLAHRDENGICWVNINQLTRLLLLAEKIRIYIAALVLRVEMMLNRPSQLPDELVEFAQLPDE